MFAPLACLLAAAAWAPDLKDPRQKLLEREIQDRREAADKFEQLGKVDRATELREAASIVTRYLVRCA